MRVPQARGVPKKESIYHKVTKDTKDTEGQDNKTGQRGFFILRAGFFSEALLPDFFVSFVTLW